MVMAEFQCGLWLTAQSGVVGGNAASWKIVIAVALLIAVTALLGMVILTLRRKLLAKPEDAINPAGMLEEFRRLHARGEISDAQFQAARVKYANKVQKHLRDSPPKALAEGRGVARARKLDQRQTTAPAGDEGTGGAGVPRPPLAGERRARPGFDLTGAPLPVPPGTKKGNPPDAAAPPGNGADET